MKGKMKKDRKKSQRGPVDRLDKEIRSIIAEIIEVKENKIGPDTDFTKELDMNSMTALEILAAIEKKYKIEIPEESLPKIRNLNDTIRLTRKLLS